MRLVGSLFVVFGIALARRAQQPTKDTLVAPDQRRRRAPKTTTLEPHIDLPKMRPVPEGMKGADEYLWIVDEFIRNQPRNPNGLLQTYGPGKLGGGNCGKHCHLPVTCPAKSAVLKVNQYCRHDTYDNALTAIYLTKRGKYTEAKKILDTFLGLMYPKHMTESVNNNCHGPSGLPSGRKVCLVAASYTVEGAKAGDYHTPATTAAGSFVDTGNNAWVGMAFSRYAAATGDACYATAAHDIMHILDKHRCDDELGGYMGRMKPTLEHYRSIEHNIDMAAFARMLGAKKGMASAQKFVANMFTERDEYFHYDGAYVVGTKGGKKRCNTEFNHGALPIDAQIWSTAAHADSNKTREHMAMHFASHKPGDGCTRNCNSNTVKGHGGWATDVDQIGKAGEGVGDLLHGMRFSNTGAGIQWEITASGAIAMADFHNRYGDTDLDLKRHMNLAKGSIKKLLKRYHAVPASIRGGNIVKWRHRIHTDLHPGGSDTGLGWTYLRYPHLASTVWSGLMLIQQYDKDSPIDNEGNPFQPPVKTVPGPIKNGQCLP